MGSCRDNKLKYNCGTRHNARCVSYDGNLPEFSELEDCVTIEETTEELYDNLQEIKDSIDLSELGKKCINYSDYKKDKDLKVKEAFLAIENQICLLKENNENDCCIDIEKLDLKCLVDPCDNPINNQTQLIQIMINQMCELKTLITNG